MPNTFLSYPNMRSQIDYRLSRGVVQLELGQDDKDRAIADAVREYNRYLPQRSRATLTVGTSTRKYAVSHTGLVGVVAVDFVEQFTNPNTPDVFSFEREGIFPRYYGAGELTQLRDYTEQAREISGNNPTWFGQWEGSAYYLYVHITRDMLCSYEYLWAVNTEGVPTDTDPSGYGDYGLKHISDADTNWVIDFAVARLKQVLGRGLRKFGGVVNPDGGADTIDGTELVSEGREDEQKLIEDIKLRRRPLLPIMGGQS